MFPMWKEILLEIRFEGIYIYIKGSIHQDILYAMHAVCPRSFDPFNIVSYYIRWAKTSYIYSSESIFSITLTVFIKFNLYSIE